MRRRIAAGLLATPLLLVVLAVLVQEHPASADVDISGQCSLTFTHSAPSIGVPSSFQCAASIVQSEGGLNMSATCPEFLGILDFHGTISADGTFGLSETPFGVSLTGTASQEILSGTWRIENVAGEDTFTGSRSSLHPGDANCDGAVDSIDALEILQFIGSEDSLPCEPFADADLSGAVNEFDAIVILRGEAQITEFPCKVGDVVNDGIVNSADALAILQLASGVEPPLNWLPCLYLADVNHDGSVNAVDAQLVLQYVSTH